MIPNGEATIGIYEAAQVAGVSPDTIMMLARAGKLKFSKLSRTASTGFFKNDLEELIEAYTLRRIDGKAILSDAIRSQLIAREKKHSAGKLITKRDAAFLLDCSRRGVEYHITVGHLRSVAFGHRTVALLRRDVFALHRKRVRYRRQIGSNNI